MDGVRGPLIPISSHAHLRRHRSDEMLAKEVGGAPASVNMLQQRLRLELREHIDGQNTRIYEVGENEIDNSVPSAEWYRRFGPVLRQRMETFASTARQNDT